jgi:hypothetical protein
MRTEPKLLSFDKNMSDHLHFRCHSRESGNPAFCEELDARTGGHDAPNRGHDLFKTQ